MSFINSIISSIASSTFFGRSSSLDHVKYANAVISFLIVSSSSILLSPFNKVLTYEFRKVKYNG